MDILERFKKYISFETISSETSGTHPSNPNEIVFANLLKDDLKDLGLEAKVTDKGYVYAFINNDQEKTIGLIAHMDTSPSLIGGIKNPKLVKNYDGSIIKLNEKYALNPKDFSFLNDLKGEDLLVTDGEHLLGGDDKAGIAVIFSFLEYYLNHKKDFIYNLAICFTPDEEIGEGSMFFDVKEMKADLAYTLDGGCINYASYENFNASSAVINIKGVGIHPGSAKGVMVNAAVIAGEIIASLPENQRPSTTDGYDGFIHVANVSGDVEEANIYMIIRDFNYDLLKDKESFLIKTVNFYQNKYEKSTISLKINEGYKNMAPLFVKDNRALELINKAYLKSGVKLSYEPIRGGTDGATISYMGLLCPNLGNGDYNCHGRYEFVSVTQMKKMVDILKEMFSTKI